MPSLSHRSSSLSLGHASGHVSSPSLQDMTRFLERSAPSCASAALSVLRTAFPSAPLQLRVDAYETYAHQCVITWS